jgi:hypothetical protein
MPSARTVTRQTPKPVNDLPALVKLATKHLKIIFHDEDQGRAKWRLSGALESKGYRDTPADIEAKHVAAEAFRLEDEHIRTAEWSVAAFKAVTAKSREVKALLVNFLNDARCFAQSTAYIIESTTPKPPCFDLPYGVEIEHMIVKLKPYISYSLLTIWGAPS